MAAEGDGGAGPSTGRQNDKETSKEEEVQNSLNRLLISGNGASHWGLRNPAILFVKV